MGAEDGQIVRLVQRLSSFEILQQNHRLCTVPVDQLRVIASDIDIGVLFSGRGLGAVVKVHIVVPDEVAEGHVVHAGSRQVERL